MIRALVCLCAALVFSGCANPKPVAWSRPFVFHQDSFAFTNETVWDYRVDPATGKATHAPRESPPSYSHHCFVVARSARQFFQHARFDARQAVAEDATYRRLIRRVVSLDPARESSENQKVVIPGYANLYTFSQAHAALLQAECGGAWQSYFQRGHWRMILPMSTHHQEKMAEQLLASLRQNRPPIVHLVRFPQLSINHAVVLFAADETAREIEFTVYDPNTPTKPVQLKFNRAQRRFIFPANDYFAGGRVDVYQIYHAWNY
jgi:hypothetical protein